MCFLTLYSRGGGREGERERGGGGKDGRRERERVEDEDIFLLMSNNIFACFTGPIMA